MSLEGTSCENSPSTATSTLPDPEHPLVFLAYHGGPFYEMQRRLSMLRDSALMAGQRTLVFVSLAWFVPLLLSLSSTLSLEPGAFIMDPGAWAKFLIAISAFVLAEQQVELGLSLKLEQFVKAPLIAPTSLPAAADALATALRRRNSGIAEGCCLAFGVLLSVIAHRGISPMSTWSVDVFSDGSRITLAGWWSLFVSLPLFGFLLLRGLWRHLVWALLLRRIAALDLRLVSTHPDGRGGLAFLSEYPNAYVLFVLGISAAMAAGIARHIAHETISIATLSSIMGGWLIIVLASFYFPLSAFSKPLSVLKEKSLLVLSTEATLFQRAAERTAVGKNVAANAPEEAEDPVEAADVTKQFEATRKLSITLIDRSAVLPVSVAALLPFALVGVMKLPFKDVISVLKKLLLL
ncbi:hypothetical protein [Phyllobacterium ifriqiyense]|uniref:hypothetical protein n=1 Tax=Phyllobacterium ifriqiyense TaxID=314238 RepID=UPI0033943963